MALDMAKKWGEHADGDARPDRKKMKNNGVYRCRN